MSKAEDANVGELIHDYRERAKMTVRTLAEQLGVHHTHIVRWEKGERSLRSRPQLARKLVEKLGFERDDLALFRDLTGLAALDRSQLEVEAQEDAEAGETEAYEDAKVLLLSQMADRRFRAAVTRMRYVGVWAPARLLALLYQMRLSSKWLASAARQAEEDPADSELIPIVLLDAADVFVTVGNLEQAVYYARLSERRAHAFLKTATGVNDRARLHMGVARAMLVRQAIAHLRNCHALAWDLHAQVATDLAAAGDDYGWAKTYYLLAWMYFHQGDLEAAEGLALLALAAAKDIEPHYPQTDFWWSLRDGIYLGGTWWRLICLTLLLDISLCRGDSTSERYYQLDAAYRVERRKTVWWAKDLPAQRTRYPWVAEWGRASGRELERRLRWRTKKARDWAGFLYLPDMLLSYGDFLAAQGDTAGARTQYRRAKEAGHEGGYTFMEAVAERRLDGGWVPPVVEKLRRNRP